MKPTLLVLAAGMGSRYGGLKQMDGLGPSGETIIDYSIYDAVQAGFGKVVYIVREYFKEQMEETVRAKYAHVDSPSLRKDKSRGVLPTPCLWPRMPFTSLSWSLTATTSTESSHSK